MECRRHSPANPEGANEGSILTQGPSAMDPRSLIVSAHRACRIGWPDPGALRGRAGGGPEGSGLGHCTWLAESQVVHDSIEEMWTALDAA